MRAALGDRLIFATHNQGKVDEMRALFQPHGVTIVSAVDLGLPEPVETETTFVGNARIKAHAAAKAMDLPALADDSGLCVDALDGAPGVNTADWAEGPGGRDFRRAMARTHAELVARRAAEPWRAEFRCTLVLAWPNGSDAVYEGVVRGQLVWPIRGAVGHGYDPMFMPEGAQHTFAEMASGRKNRISHRAAALNALIAGCFT